MTAGGRVGPHPWTLVHLETVGSTNDYVKAFAGVLADRTAVYADTQSTGRGRDGRVWASPPGGLYASLLLKPPPSPEHASRLSLLAAGLLCDMLEGAGARALVKWPNDILVENRKIAGLLPEYGTHPAPWYVLGLGMNLATVPRLPDARGLEPTSLASYGTPPEPAAVLLDLLSRLDSAWPDRTADPLAGRIPSLTARLWQLGGMVRLARGGETVTGTLVGIGDDGSVRIATLGGTRSFESGELRPL